MVKYCLFIGRFQPFHEGHKKLIETVMKEGKLPLIAVRDTKLSKENPYPLEERILRIREALPGVEVISIPDIEAVCYGRNVGYEIREIRLDNDTESISGTEIRNKPRAA